MPGAIGARIREVAAFRAHGSPEKGPCHYAAAANLSRATADPLWEAHAPRYLSALGLAYALRLVALGQAEATRPVTAEAADRHAAIGVTPGATECRALAEA